MRIISCVFITIIFYSFVAQYKPYQNDGLNIIHVSCQLVLTITFFAGYVVESWERGKHGQFLGTTLLLINLMVLLNCVYQQVKEPQFEVIEAILDQQPFDERIAASFEGSTKVAFIEGENS